MTIEITASFGFTLPQPADVLLQFEAASMPQQEVIEPYSWLPVTSSVISVPALDAIGCRYWIHAVGECRIDYRSRVRIRRDHANLSALNALPPHLLPGSAVQYLFESRYCMVSRLHDLVGSEFAGLEGGAKIAAMRDWITREFSYLPGSSDTQTNALDTLASKQGICRDYAHVLISMARAANIPARYVSCYASGVTPQDFHAIAEVFLVDPAQMNGGAWHMVDPTGMADPASTAIIGIGRDAADVSFMTVFGEARFDFSSVSVQQIGG